MVLLHAGKISERATRPGSISKLRCCMHVHTYTYKPRLLYNRSRKHAEVGPGRIAAAIDETDGLDDCGRQRTERPAPPNRGPDRDLCYCSFCGKGATIGRGAAAESGKNSSGAGGAFFLCPLPAERRATAADPASNSSPRDSANTSSTIYFIWCRFYVHSAEVHLTRPRRLQRTVCLLPCALAAAKKIKLSLNHLGDAPTTSATNERKAHLPQRHPFEFSLQVCDMPPHLQPLHSYKRCGKSGRPKRAKHHPSPASLDTKVPSGSHPFLIHSLTEPTSKAKHPPPW